MQLFTTQFQKDAVAATIAVGGDLHTVLVHLYTNPTPAPGDHVLGDFTEPTFPGYGAVGPLTWSAVFVDPNENASVIGSEAVFICTGVATDTIVGYFITDSPATKVFAWEQLDNPIGITDAGDGFGLVVPYSLPQAASASVIS